MNRLDPTFVRAQIEALRYSHPDIWEDGDEQLLADMLEGETGLHELLAQILDRRQGAEVIAEGIDKLFTLWKARLGRAEQTIDAMRTMAVKVMDQAGVRSVKLPAATLSIRNGQSKVVITDEAALPEECFRIERKPSRTAIRKLIDAGQTVPGAELSNAEPYLQVTIK